MTGLPAPPADIIAWAEHELGAPVVAQAPIGNGASRQIWALETEAAGGPRTVVLRFDPGTGPVSGTALDLGREATVYAALRDTGIPIPRLIAADPGGRALLMERVTGDAEMGAVDDPARRRAIGRDYLTWLGRLHALDVGALALGSLTVPATGPAHVTDDLDLWASILRDRGGRFATPAAEVAIGWLRANVPATASGTSVCHGDAGPGNFLFEGDHVSALLDWEFAHVGDPHDDLAWVAVRNPLLGSPIDLADAYAAWHDVTGLAVEPDRLEYHRVLVLTRMLISCDAAIAWVDGVVDERTLTHSILRPWLATAALSGIGLAGGGSTEVDRALAAATATAEASEHAAVVAMIPPLEPFRSLRKA